MGDGERRHSTQPYTGTSGFLPLRQGLLVNFRLVLLQVSVKTSRKPLRVDWQHPILFSLAPEHSKLYSTSCLYPEQSVHLLHQQLSDKLLPAPSHQDPNNLIASGERRLQQLKKIKGKLCAKDKAHSNEQVFLSTSLCLKTYRILMHFNLLFISYKTLCSSHPPENKLLLINIFTAVKINSRWKANTLVLQRWHHIHSTETGILNTKLSEVLQVSFHVRLGRCAFISKASITTEAATYTCVFLSPTGTRQRARPCQSSDVAGPHLSPETPHTQSQHPSSDTAIVENSRRPTLSAVFGCCTK